MRDTDRDWCLLGAEQPFWGVLAAPEYRTEALTPQRVERFYETGRLDIELFSHLVERASGERPRAPGRALDFGCGVGRLSEAMAAQGFAVTGVDVSPGMLDRARTRGGSATYRQTLPEGAFDWVNSYIVFQHIPPERGLPLIGQLLDRLAPGGAVTLHVPFSREAALRLPEAEPPPPGVMSMYEYDLNKVSEVLWTRGVRRLHLHPLDGGGSFGFVIAGRREFA